MSRAHGGWRRVRARLDEEAGVGGRRGRTRGASDGALDWFRRLESFFQEGVERPLRSVFRAPLQPVEVGKAAAQALEQSQVIGLRGPRVANQYEIRLSPSDFSRFAAYRISLAREVEAHLEDSARRLNAVPVDSWTVELLPDQGVRTGQVRVTASAADVLEPAGLEQPSASEFTERLQPLRSEATTRGVLVLDSEERQLHSPMTSIGRALDNHVVLDDNRVSRYHAQIHERGGEYRVKDLASTNGTFVSGRRVTDEILDPGDDVSFGGVVLRFELRRL